MPWTFDTFTPYQQSIDGGAYATIADVPLPVERVRTRVGFSVANGLIGDTIALGVLVLQKNIGGTWTALSTWKNVDPTYTDPNSDPEEPTQHIGDHLSDDLTASAVEQEFRYKLEYTDGDWYSTAWTIAAVASAPDYRDIEATVQPRAMTAGCSAHALVATAEARSVTTGASRRAETATVETRTATAGV